MDSLSLTFYVCPELITILTCIPMGDVLTSTDFHIGHNDLGQPMVVDPISANTIHSKQLDYLLLLDLCRSSNLPNSDNKWLL